MKKELVKGYIGQLHSMQDSIEEYLDESEFADLCDCISTIRTYLSIVNKRQVDRCRLEQIPIDQFEDNWNENYSPVFTPGRGFEYARKTKNGWISMIDNSEINPSHFYKPFGKEVEV